ncbi:sugar transferase [Tessaracoccus sp. OS52]|uniref:sugar transferase n=1 Tax=Tessaracoccus sp. OS52 TaxID=2886691 RepID=UPI001D117DDC|nr:sugar transferase [Tessaracoccus sp. OS52]
MLAARTQRSVLLAVDLLMITVGFTAAVAWGLARDLIHYTPELVLVTVGLSVGWLIALALTGTYSLRHLRAGSVEYKRAINATAWAAGVFGVMCFLLNYSYPRTMFVVWIGVGVLGLCVARYLRRRVMHRLHAMELFQTPVIVAGSDHHVDEVAMVLNRERWMGYKMVGAVTRQRLQATATGLPVLGQIEDLVDVIASRNVSVVIFAEGSFDSPSDFRRLAWKLEESQVQMIVAPTMADVSAERLVFRPVAGLPLVDVARPTATRSLRWFKRASDVLASSVLLLLFAPVLLATAIAVKLEDGGPVIFRQRRVGLKGEEFNCLKFRSMCVDAEARLAALRDKNEGAGVLFKMADDPRITKVGKFIRRFSLDELPQLWNALRGDMSLVGPRPALPREVEQYDTDTRRRLQVRPGLTGLWQVSGRSRLSWEDTVRLDLYYVDNWSVVQDLMILVKTARAVIGSAGAY